MQVDLSGRAADDSQIIRPRARMEALDITETEAEVLLYDQTNNQIHHMNPSATAVWRACDGQRNVAAIVRETGLEDESVRMGLALLAGRNLLDSGFEPGSGGKQTRRSFLRKAGLASIPAIVSITAPIAKAAASGGTPGGCGTKPATCVSDLDCCSGYFCNNGMCDA